MTGQIVPTNDVVIPATSEPSSTSGCEATDFTRASTTAPQVALVQRGACNFSVKAANAQAAGYDAVVLMNEGNPGRTDLFIGTLERPFTIPVVGVSSGDGAALVAAARAGVTTVRVVTSTESRVETTKNILADSRQGDPEKVVVVGAHLDSVIAGAGINDNGSGTSAILEIAEEMAELGIKPRQQLRFAFLGRRGVRSAGIRPLRRSAERCREESPTTPATTWRATRSTTSAPRPWPSLVTPPHTRR